MRLSVYKKYTKVRPVNPQKFHVQTLEPKGNPSQKAQETHPKPSKSPFL